MISLTELFAIESRALDKKQKEKLKRKRVASLECSASAVSECSVVKAPKLLLATGPTCPTSTGSNTTTCASDSATDSTVIAIEKVPPVKTSASPSRECAVSPQNSIPASSPLSMDRSHSTESKLLLLGEKNSYRSHRRYSFPLKQTNNASPTGSEDNPQWEECSSHNSPSRNTYIELEVKLNKNRHKMAAAAAAARYKTPSKKTVHRANLYNDSPFYNGRPHTLDVDNDDNYSNPSSVGSLDDEEDESPRVYHKDPPKSVQFFDGFDDNCLPPNKRRRHFSNVTEHGALPGILHQPRSVPNPAEHYMSLGSPTYADYPLVPRKRRRHLLGKNGEPLGVLKCAICGDSASGYHYNALSCEGCKG